MSNGQHFTFKRTDKLGAADANEDDQLSEVFIDGGELDVLEDVTDPRSVVLGRTGSGKTALLRMLGQQKDHVITLDPQTLSLNHISNSNILSFLEELGIKVDIFYELLWRHVLVIELLKYKYQITNEDKQKQFMDNLRAVFDRDKGKKQGIEYVQKWADKFWIETETTIREITSHLERDLNAAVGFNNTGGFIGAGAARKLSQEERDQIEQRCKAVVSKVQIKELNNVVQLLAEDIFVDNQEKYYVVIDDLDLGWAQEEVRLDLIIALLKTIKNFRKIQPVKIIIALRIDLLDLVLKRASSRDKGFQQEKFRSYYLELKWAKNQLHELLDKRVNRLARHRYTKKKVFFKDILPDNRPKKISAVDYVLERTQLRPREAILYLNSSIELAAGKSRLTWRNITDAEARYSRERLHSIIDEWNEEYPLIECYLRLLEGQNSKFKYRQYDEHSIEEFKSSVFAYIGEHGIALKDPLLNWIESNNNNQLSDNNFLVRVMRVLYRVGALGARVGSGSGIVWSFNGPAMLSEGQIKPTTDLFVHPSLDRALHISRQEPGAIVIQEG